MDPPVSPRGRLSLSLGAPTPLKEKPPSDLRALGSSDSGSSSRYTSSSDSATLSATAAEPRRKVEGMDHGDAPPRRRMDPLTATSAEVAPAPSLTGPKETVSPIKRRTHHVDTDEPVHVVTTADRDCRADIDTDAEADSRGPASSSLSAPELKLSADATLDFRERANPKQFEATVSQTLDTAFFSTMKIATVGPRHRASLVSNEPLHQAVLAGDEIDVHMILAELGSGAIGAIAARDADGRTALHVAALSGSARITALLLGAYRAYEGQLLEYDLLRLEGEYRKTLDDLKLKAAAAHGDALATNKSLKRDIEKKTAAVDDWFEKERVRRLRALEFRVEIWWAKCITAKDHEGRTPLHYCVGAGATRAVLEALLCVPGPAAGAANSSSSAAAARRANSSNVRRSATISRSSTGTVPLCGLAAAGDAAELGRGVFYEENPDVPRKDTQFRFGGLGCRCACPGGTCDHGGAGPASSARPKAVILRSIFDDGCMYDLASGRAMAAYARPRYALDTGTATVTGLHLAEPKGPHATARPAAADYGRTTLKTISWDLAGLGGALGNGDDDAVAVDYDIVIPWVLRNMVKSAGDRAAGGRTFATGIDLLEDLFHSLERRGDADADADASGAVLVVPELRAVLSELGIRVTVDILQEMCRRYPADMEDIRAKWRWVEKKKKEEERKAALALAEDKDDDNDGGKRGAVGSKGEGKSEQGAKGGGGRDDDDIDDGEFRRRYGRDSKDGRSSPGGEEKGAKGSGARMMSLRSSASRASLAASNGYFSSLAMSRADENLGLDVRAMLDDVASGRGLRSLVKPTEYATMSGQPLDDELRELLDDGQGAGEKVRGGRAAGADHRGSTRGHPAAPSVELPACVTVTGILKARKGAVNVCDAFGRTPLLVAAALAHRDLLSVLLQHGGDISIVTPEGHSAFTVARSTSVRMLLEKPLLAWMNRREHVRGRGGVAASAERAADDALMDALERLNRDVAAVDRVLESSGGGSGLLRASHASIGGDANGSGAADEQLLFTSTMRTAQREEVVAGLSAQLRGLQDSSWSYGRPPLLWAVHNGLPAAVREMLAAGADPNAADAVGRRALHECAALTHSRHAVHAEAAAAIADMLVTAGADVDATSVSGRTPLHEVFCMSQDDAVSCYRLSYKGVSAMCANTAKATPAPHATACRRQLVRALLRLGASPLLGDRHGMAADDVDCLMEIIRAGHNVAHPTPQRQTPLHVACKAGAAKVVQLLCRWDADSPWGTGGALCKDVNGKLPPQLLPRTTSASCCDTLWGAARAGNVARVADLLNRPRADAAAWEGVEESGSDLHALAVALDVKFNLGGSGSGGNNGTGAADAKDDERRAERENKGDKDGGDGGALRASVRAPRLKPSSGGQELWLVDGIDAKTRRLRWSPLHACVIGWAEHRGLQYLKGKTGRGWNEPAPPLGGTKKGRAEGLVSATAIRALGLGRSHAAGYFGAAAQHREVLALLLRRHAFLDSLDVNCRTPLMLAAACNLSDAVGMLLDAGADVGVYDLERNSSLHIAYAYGSLSSALMIEGKGGDAAARNGRQRTPTEEAGRQASLLPLLALEREKT